MQQVGFETPKRQIKLPKQNAAKKKLLFRLQTQSTMDSIGSDQIVGTYAQEFSPKISSFQINTKIHNSTNQPQAQRDNNRQKGFQQMLSNISL